MSLNRLTIHLLNDVMEPDDALEPDRPSTPVELSPSSGLSGRFYYTVRPAAPPPWVSFIDGVIGTRPERLVSSSASGLLGRV